MQNSKQSGWVRLYRMSLNNDVYRFDPTAWRVFTSLLVLVDRNGKWKGGRYQLAGILNMNPNTTKDAISRLKKSKMIVYLGTTKYTEISICKWTEFQSDDTSRTPAGHQPDTSRTPAGHHYNKNKEVRSKNNIRDLVDHKSLFFELVKSLGFTDKVKYLDGRARWLKLRLKKFTPDEIRKAAEVIASNPYLQGENPNGVRYGDIDYLLRDDKQIDKHLNSEANQTTYKADW